MSSEQIYAVISRVLCVSWKDEEETSEGYIRLVDVPASLKASTCKNIDNADLISRILMEVLGMFSRGEDPLKEVKKLPMDVENDCDESTQDSNNHASNGPVDSSSAQCTESYSIIPFVASVNKTSQPKSFVYLTNCYSRIGLEERNQPKVFIQELHEYD